VNSDGTFTKHVELTEGENVFALEFIDLADNVANRWLNVTLDTQAPAIILDQIDTTVRSNSINITGTTEAGANIRVNGKPVQVEETRQQTGTFSKQVRLSPGQNTLVIESKDTAGNVQELYQTVTYDTTSTGPNYGAIGLMILLLVIGLLIGVFVVQMIFGGRPPKEKEEEPTEEVPTVEEDTEEAPEETIVETIVEPDEEPEVDDEFTGEPLPDEEAMPVEEPFEETEIEAEPEGDMEQDVEGLPEEEGEMEPVTEDVTQEEPETIEPEDEPVEAEQLADDIIAEDTMEEAPALEEDIPVEDEKVLKLKKAFEEGKISQELYEKNLKRLQG
jgi:hypothetical protein